MLSLVFGPRIDEKSLKILSRKCGIIIYTPARRAVSAANSLILVDRFEKLRGFVKVDPVFDGKKHRTRSFGPNSALRCPWDQLGRLRRQSGRPLERLGPQGNEAGLRRRKPHGRRARSGGVGPRHTIDEPDEQRRAIFGGAWGERVRAKENIVPSHTRLDTARQMSVPGNERCASSSIARLLLGGSRMR
jgi:hypothetical protein